MSLDVLISYPPPLCYPIQCTVKSGHKWMSILNLNSTSRLEVQVQLKIRFTSKMYFIVVFQLFQPHSDFQLTTCSLKKIFHADECLLPLLCFLGRLRFPLFVGLALLVGADTEGQSLPAILLKSSQSQPEAIADPCRPSKAAPTHLTMIKMWRNLVVVGLTSDRKRSHGPPWLDGPMRKSRCQNA